MIGSVAFGALARLVMLAARQQDGDDGKAGPRVLMRAKSNIGPDDGGFHYELQLVPMRSRPDIIASVVYWKGAVSGNARDILAAAEATDGNGDAAGRREAEDFLLDLLADGPKSARECKAAATEAALSLITVKRAKSKLGIVSVKDGMTGGWVWSLPEGDHRPRSGSPSWGMSPFQENDPLRGESEVINNGSSRAMGDGWEVEI